MVAQCDDCGHRMVSTDIRTATNGEREVWVDSCGKCGNVLEEIPNGYELQANQIA